MPSYCFRCDEFYDYKRLTNTKKCPNCGNELNYYDSHVIARKLAPVKARCMNCKLICKKGCPEDKETVRQLIKKLAHYLFQKKM